MLRLHTPTRPILKLHAPGQAILAMVLCALLLVACDDEGGDPPADNTEETDAPSDIEPDGDPDATDLSQDGDALDSADSADAEEDIYDGPTITVVTFNTGTGPEAPHDEPPDDGYSSEDALITDEWYGNGLNYPPLIEDTRVFLNEIQPDIIVFQEIFWTGECPDIPADAQTGFVCESWMEGDPTVAQMILGEGYQLMCHPEKPDKCAAVKRSFGTFRGCEEDFCLEGMEGYPIEGCGSGARVARGVIDPVDGSDPITLINYHGSSGFTDEELQCRVKQTDRVFVDFGDGEPGVNGVRNLVMGDFNTDPGRLGGSEISADRWLDFVGDNKAFQWVTEIGVNAVPTYAGFFNIDHVVSDVFQGECWAPEVYPERDVFTDIVYYDHLPIVCELRWP